LFSQDSKSPKHSDQMIFQIDKSHIRFNAIAFLAAGLAVAGNVSLGVVQPIDAIIDEDIAPTFPVGLGGFHSADIAILFNEDEELFDGKFERNGHAFFLGSGDVASIESTF
jgi:hypothetical protein